MAAVAKPAAATPNPLVAAKPLVDVPLSQLVAAKAHADVQNPLVVAKALVAVAANLLADAKHLLAAIRV